MLYGIIRDNVIINVIVWNGVTDYNPGPSLTLIKMADLPIGCDIGWTNINGTWTAPEQVE